MIGAGSVKRLAVSLTALCLALGGCTKSPQEVCSPDAALGTLRKIVLSLVPGNAPKEAHPLILKASELITLENAVVDSYDEASGRVDCRGTISWTGPKGSNTTPGRVQSLQIVYTGQPDAGGSGEYIYTASRRELQYIGIWLAGLRPAGWQPPARDAGYTAEDARRASYAPLIPSPGEDTGQPKVTSPAEFDRQSGLSAREQRLADEFIAAEGDCRMKNDTAGEAACRRNDQLLAQLNAQGLCWGRSDEARADYTVHRCSSNSLR